MDICINREDCYSVIVIVVIHTDRHTNCLPISKKTLNFVSNGMLFLKLLYFHNTSVDNLWHTFQLPLGKILASWIQNRLIFKTKIIDISRISRDI